MRKQTHNLCNIDIFKWIPLIPLDRIWTNEELHKYLELDKNIIKFINELTLDGTYTKD